MMAQHYDVEMRTINYHLQTIFSDGDLNEASVIRVFRITAADGKHYDRSTMSAEPVDMEQQLDRSAI